MGEKVKAGDPWIRDVRRSSSLSAQLYTVALHPALEPRAVGSASGRRDQRSEEQLRDVLRFREGFHLLNHLFPESIFVFHDWISSVVWILYHRVTRTRGSERASLYSLMQACLASRDASHVDAGPLRGGLVPGDDQGRNCPVGTDSHSVRSVGCKQRREKNRRRTPTVLDPHLSSLAFRASPPFTPFPNSVKLSAQA